ncbi:CHAT domain-containing protein [Rhizoctonia solani]|nr:CHAT domain-containing protein [Rhizoctonia solani]
MSTVDQNTPPDDGQILALSEACPSTCDGHSPGHGVPWSKVFKQLPNTKLKPLNDNGGDLMLDDDAQYLADNTSEGLSQPLDQDKEFDKSIAKSSQTEDSSMEEGSLKMMLSHFFGDINTTIELQSQLVSLIPDHRSDKPSQLNDLSISYQTRFERFGELNDIEKTMEYLHKAISLISAGHPGQPVCLSNLGSAYRNRYERLGSLEDLQKVTVYQEQAILLTPDTYEDKPTWFNNLGNTYQRRFERLDDSEDLQKAIDFKLKRNLGSVLKSRFERRGDLVDIDQAIDYQSQAVALTSDDKEDKPNWLNSLGISYLRRFERLGQADDIENAVACQVKVLSLTPQNYADRSTWMSNLGISYQHRYKILGDTRDITRSIDYQSQALSLCPESHYKKPSMHLSLGNSIYHRFLRFGRVTDLDKAVEGVSIAISLLPAGHSDKPTWLNNLGGFYIHRFQLLNEQRDIQKATDYLIKSLSLVPDDHTQKPEILANLANSYLLRSESLLVDVAITCLEREILLTPDGHEIKPTYVQRLGNSRRIRYKNTTEPKDINEAIRYQTTAVTSVPDKFAYKASWLDELGQSYHDRYDCNADPEDLNQAIVRYKAALSSNPDDYAYSSEFSYHLASAYEARFTQCGSQEDLGAATLSYQQASRPTSGNLNPLNAFSAARKCAQLSSSHQLPSAREAYQRAMELVPQVLWLGSTIETRYHQIRNMGDFASEAASYAISLQLYDLALEWLEQGRSIIWNQILELRTPFDEVSIVDKDLARNLERAGSTEANLIFMTGEMLDLGREAQRHRKLASEWDQLLAKEFLRPKCKKHLMDASKNGPVVVINIGESQGDALILVPNSSEIAHALSLRGLLFRGTRGIKRFGYNPRIIFEKVLATFFLGIKIELASEELPHITWCTTGDLVGLPLHAAGLYDGSQPGAFDLIISSYTPTISTLLASFCNLPCEFSGIIAVGQENTRGFPRIPNTVTELAAIKEKSKTIPSTYLELENEQATIDAVLSGMEQCSWVHFACHASQKGDDLTNSAFHLYDGSLKISTIIQQAFKNKGLVYLPACQTATGTEDLPDEAVHLAAGLLMVGYPSVIATPWSIHDGDAPEVSGELYADLITEMGPDYTGAAKALHAAVQKLRTKVGCRLFERWIPFIHLGA